MTSVDPITCHILDTTVGKPADDVLCQISYLGAIQNPDTVEIENDIKPFARAKTDKDGRIKQWTTDPYSDLKALGIDSNKNWNELKSGIYKIKFYTGSYFKRIGSPSTFFPFVEITFQIENPPDNHYHVPLLLSNHSYTTYRGS
ncbi:hypothetical protein DFJ63DRAFT_217004 [Scheffersomyces coipomensis]|uniref:uncharacterized protein n=1 Tax=Scheffersomyces coipomensis TaxID=1788519 RepID=UPI00315D1695